MIKKSKMLLPIIGFLVLVLVFMLQPVNALTYSIQPPRMILRGETGEISAHVDVANPNNQTVNVRATPIGEIADFTVIEEKNISLEPNMTSRFEFVFDVKNPGNYTGEIIFAFVPVNDSHRGAGLASQVYLFVEGEEAQEPEPEPVEDPLSGLLVLLPGLGIIGGIIIIIALAFLFIRRKR